MNALEAAIKYLECDEETKEKIDRILIEAIQDEEETGGKE